MGNPNSRLGDTSVSHFSVPDHKAYPKTPNNPFGMEPSSLFGAVDNTCTRSRNLATKACRLRDVLLGQQPISTSAAQTGGSKPMADAIGHEAIWNMQRTAEDIDAASAALQQIADYLGVGIPGVE